MASWQHRVERVQPDVGQVLGDERAEKEMRKAEMEAQKVCCLAVQLVCQDVSAADCLTQALHPR